MPKAVIQYDLLISCPGDIVGELQIIEDVVKDFNNRYTKHCGITIHTEHWSKNSYPQSGGKPQDLLNEQFVEECDAAVALFWTRFGTPTDKYGSGTEEEIEIMLNAGKQVFMYFSDKPLNPSKIDANEKARIDAFRQKYKDRGIYFCYSSDEEFKELLSAHLTQYFFVLNEKIKEQEKRSPELQLRGINADGTVSDQATVVPFKPNCNQNKEQYLAEIRGLYDEINNLHIEPQVKANDSEDDSIILKSDGAFEALNRKCSVTIDEDKKNAIDLIAKSLEIEMYEDFFDLGSLAEYPLLSTLPTGRGQAIEGSKEEKHKYHQITRLYETIINCLNWAALENAYAELHCIKLAVENAGTTFDEDIEVELLFDNDVLMEISETSHILNKSQCKYVLDEFYVDELIAIPASSQYKEYNDSKSTSAPSFTPPLMDISSGKDYDEDYVEALKDAYIYKIYPGEKKTLRIGFDYIKQHTAVAFPTVIFVKKIPSEIPYKITSKQSADVISGVISVAKS